ncbi:MAG TPA: PPOX class F420-dependent oxidoreductase [Acidimicrobiales bacterium]|nr:PPOX class F420-dependent oxidoreductase [Acidimicrobiales bacterium]
MTVIPESHADILDSKGFAHVATIGPEGEPQSTPVWYGTEGDRILFSLTTARQKYRNLQADPRLALSITDPENPYRYLEVRGVATEFRPDPDRAFIDSMAAKYMGVDEYPFHQPGDERVVVVVEPRHCTAMG